MWQWQIPYYIVYKPREGLGLQCLKTLPVYHFVPIDIINQPMKMSVTPTQQESNCKTHK